MQRWSDAVLDPNGNAIRGATVTVTVTSSGAAASLFSINGATAQDNPMTTGSDGEYYFYAANGRYTVTIEATGYASDSKEVILFDPADAGIVSVKDYGAKGDGTTADRDALLAAFTAAVGKHLYIPAGTYLIGSQVQLTSSFNNILVTGDGDATVIKLAAGVNTNLLRINGSSDITFENLTFDFNGANNSTTSAYGLRILNGAARIKFRNCRFLNSYYDNVLISASTASCEDISFIGCDFNGTQDANAANIKATDFSGLLVDGCTFTDWGYDSIALTFFADVKANVRIVNNRFLNTDSTFFAIETVGSGTGKVYRLKNCLIANNIFDGGGNATGGSGISGVSDNVTVTGNVWVNNAAGTHRSGVEASGNNWTITGNVIDNGSIVATTSSSNSDNYTITGNKIGNAVAASWAILVGGASDEVHNVTIANNVVDTSGASGAGGGIYLGTYGSAAIIKNVVCEGNTVQNTSSSVGTGIRVRAASGAEGIRVVNNIVNGLSQGVRTDDTATDVEIAFNQTGGCATAASFNHTTGTYRIHDNAFSETLELVSADRGDASRTIVTGVDSPIQRFNTTLTANRTVTLSSTYAHKGARFRVVRQGLGAFTLDVGGLKTIASATAAFVDVEHDGSAWVLTGYGAL